jgi:hypothetical protein
VSDPHNALREHVMDGAKASPVLAYLVAWFNGVDWPMWGAFLACVYTVLLIADKLGLLSPIKGMVRRLFHRPSP